MKRIDRLTLMSHQDLACPLVEEAQGAKGATRAYRTLEYAPEACDRMQMMATVGRQEVQAQPPCPALQGGS